MNNIKSTRRALGFSVLALLLCFSMLLGTTFAWFTDTAKTGVNKIQAGTLKIDLYHEVDDETAKAQNLVADEKQPGWYSVKDNPEHAIWDYKLWEPGYTNYESVKIVNEGTLALKYVLQVTMEGAEIDEETGADLAEVIDVYVTNGAVDPESFEEVKTSEAWKKVGTLKDLFTDPDGIARGVLLPKDSETTDAVAEPVEEVIMTVALHMQEEAGNEYQGLSLGDLYINLFATQYTYESDSFDKFYDEDAYLPIVKTAGELKSALENGESVQLANDIVLDEIITIPEGAEVELNLGGNTITSTDTPIKNEGIMTISNGTLENTTVNGNATINNKGTMVLDGATIVGAPIGETAETYPEYAVSNAGNLVIEEGTTITSDRGALFLSGTGETVINGGTFVSNDIDITGNLTSHVVVVGYGANNKLTINGGTFEHRYAETSGGVVINNRSANTVYVNGGNFSGGNYYGKWDNLSDYGYGSTPTPFSVTGGTFTGIDTNYIAEGHVATQNADGTWTVDREYQKVEATEDKDANSAALSDALTDIPAGEVAYLSLGEGEYKMPSVEGSKEFTIVGTEDTVVDIAWGAYMDSSTVAFEGVTIKGSTGYVTSNGTNFGSDYAALYTPNVTYTNCTFDGPFRIGRDGATFINCTFTNLGNDYVWNMQNDTTFENCVFNTDGKAILLYADGTHGTDGVANVVIKNCTFNSTAGAKAGAIANQNCAAIEIDNHGCAFNLTTSGNTYDSNFSGEWRIKTNYDNGKAIVVNGVTYTTLALDGKTMTIDGSSNVTVID